MSNLSINYNKVDLLKINTLLDNDKINIKKIQNIIINLPSLNIVKDKNLLNNLINQGNNFAKEKDNIFVIGTGGSNLGSRALINSSHR